MYVINFSTEYFASIIEKYIYVEESGNFMVVFEIMVCIEIEIICS